MDRLPTQFTDAEKQQIRECADALGRAVGLMRGFDMIPEFSRDWYLKKLMDVATRNIWDIRRNLLNEIEDAFTIAADCPDSARSQ